METVIKILGVISITALIGLIITLPVMYLWNWLMPKIFGLITLTFWEALGLTLLCSFLFKSSSSGSK
jgi:hypothetical protein